MPDRRIKGRPLTEMLDTASELEQLEQQKREIDARLRALRSSQGGLLRSAREDAGVSLRALASSLGSSPSYVSQVENGVRGVSSSTVMTFYNAISSTGSNSVSTVRTEENQHGNEGRSSSDAPEEAAG